jgi:hypothetical protein
MDSNKIEALLNKYWNCETSLEEEQQLRDYFKQGNIPEQLKEAASLFRYFELQKKKSLSDVSFDSQILAKTRPAGKGMMMKVVYNAMRIAAGLLVVVMAVWFIRERVRTVDADTANTTEVVDTFDDPKIALEETKKALLMISKSFGRAKEETKKINILNDAQEEIKKDKQGSQL